MLMINCVTTNIQKICCHKNHIKIIIITIPITTIKNMIAFIILNVLTTLEDFTITTNQERTTIIQKTCYQKC